MIKSLKNNTRLIKRRFNFLLFYIFISSTVLAQYPYTSEITSPDPLPTPVIYDMLGDSKGYLWLATNKGLIKYNSRTFQILPFNSTLLKSVGNINEDENGIIWCANFYKQIFYVDRDTLKQFEILDANYFKQTSIINFSVSSNSLLISTHTAVIEIDKVTHKIKKIELINRIKNGGFQYSFLFNKKSYYYNRKNKLITLFDNKIIDSTDVKFFETRFGNIGNKVVIIERAKRKRLAMLFDGKKLSPLPNYIVPENAYIYHLSITGVNECWICTQNGAYLWDYKTGRTKLMFPNERVSDVVKDFQGNYWISTLDNGLLKCPNLNCIKIPSPFSGGNNNATKIIKLPNSNFLVGNTKGSISEIDNQGYFIKKIETQTETEIEFIYYDKTNNKIISDGGIAENKTGKLINEFDFGKAVDKDPYGNLIIASFNRCVIAKNNFYNTDTSYVPNNSKLYKSLDNTAMNIFGKAIKKAKLLRVNRSTFTLANQNKKGFWVAYDDGLYYYQYDGKIKILLDDKGKSVIATSLYQNKKGDLFVCTTTNGLFVLNGDNIIQKHFTTNNGLQSNNAKKIIIDNNKIWLLTDESLEMIDYSTGLIQDFFSSAGLESLTVYDFAIDSNNVFLATPNGVMRYTQTENSFGERIKITQLVAEHGNIEIASNSTLSYNKNSITIKFDAIHFKAPSKLYFQYRLLGSDSIWHSVAASNNIVNYNFLPPGNYVFEVYAVDKNLIFRSATRGFAFNIAKPFWGTWWFINLLVISLIVISFLIIKWWTNRFKVMQTAKENLLQSKLTAIRSQMNPHFLYNVLNTVQGLVYANKKSEATEMLGNFSDLMRKTLQESDKTEIVLKDEIESLQLYLALEKKRFDKDFEFNLKVDEAIDIADIHVPSMFIQPFAENAIKHGLLHKEGLKNLNINITQKENKLLVSIDDNGIGRKQSAIIKLNKKIQSTGFAIKGIEDRRAIYNAMNKVKIEFEIIDQKEGTLVNLILPVI